MAKDKYHVGQKVRLVRSRSRPELVGQVFTVLAPRRRYSNKELDISWLGYTLDISPRIERRALRMLRPKEETLEPVYDGGEKSSWTECAWKPKQLEKVE